MAEWHWWSFPTLLRTRRGRLQAQLEVAWQFANTMADHGRYPDVRNWGTRMLQALAEARDRSDPELPDHE